MSPSLHGVAMVLPEQLAIFPLDGALLLPRGQLPLNIFEPRYLNMIEDALAGNRLIGMVQTRQEADHPVPDNTPVFDVGCIGKLTSFTETDDGRYMITLTGINRFSIIEELETVRGYRRFSVNYDAFANDREEDSGQLEDRERLMTAVNDYFQATGMEADWESMDAVPDETLVTALAMVCPLEARDKQALLECAGVQDRGAFLTDLLEFHSRAGNGETSLPRH
jgi:uncharacterized protein